MTLKLMSTLAVEVAFSRTLLPAWKQSGRSIEIQWAPTAVLMKDIQAGARGDVVVMIDAQMERLAEQGIVRRDTIVPVARANFGLAVAPGAARPDISTPGAFVTALRAARSVGYSLTGASGQHFTAVMQRLGQTDVLERATTIPAGFTAELLLDGRADIAVQQISELMSVPGVEVLGPFPAPYQQPTDFSAAIFTDARAPERAAAFLDHLQTPEAGRAYRDGGLDSRLAPTLSKEPSP